MLSKELVEDTGLKINKIERLGGGDINFAFCIHENSQKYFLKLNSATRYPGMFENEKNGLVALYNNCSLKVPGVVKFGVVGSDQYLILEWLESASRGKGFWEDFGSSLASMHKKPQSEFGFFEDNYIGSLKQSNAKKNNWAQFYAEERILPLARKLYRGTDLVLAEEFCSKLAGRFPNEPASLLHGDLWSGNFMCCSGGRAAIYDPAVYCGRREMDIGMTKLFGGFDEVFYDAYDSAYPLETGWKERIPLVQLYPLMVHALLFGGGYVRSSFEIIKTFT